jgi:multimeric flavodoxin WrbA/putative sterol carrier protein
MYEKLTIVAVNGSPHAGFGNTSLMIEMLRPTLAEEGFELEIIDLSGKDIQYCVGCAFCMEKGRCWIDDDHRKIVEKLLAADGVILASPVYFMHVTGQMKTFLDRSLAFGHKPRPTWKPGLAISVSAGMGETDTAHYLAFLLRTFGAFCVGTLTAMATQPGGFWGKEAVEARARDLAGDLARAIKEKRRYPATERDLRFYQFMGNLVKGERDTMMKHDCKHWQEHGFFDSFEKYIQQETTRVPFDGQMREVWIQEMIARQKARKRGESAAGEREPQKAAQLPKTCRELIQSMPLGFHPEEAEDLKAILQFEVEGEENFVAHLDINGNRCAYHNGPAEKPNLIIRTPADVWLKISRGELNGQKAFMAGNFKVEGDMNLLLKLNRLFST